MTKKLPDITQPLISRLQGMAIQRQLGKFLEIEDEDTKAAEKALADAFVVFLFTDELQAVYEWSQANGIKLKFIEKNQITNLPTWKVMDSIGKQNICVQFANKDDYMAYVLTFEGEVE